MHLRPKCSSALILLIVNIDDLKPTTNKKRRELIIEVSVIQHFRLGKVKSGVNHNV
jgi:hypothetical protein